MTEELELTKMTDEQLANAARDVCKEPDKILSQLGNLRPGIRRSGDHNPGNHKGISAMTQASRPNSPELDTILGATFPVLDHGFIRVVDYMGNDPSIVQAARVSYGEGTTTPSEDEALIRYLMRHWHSTPFEMCEIKLHVKLPIFVARQWIRHRTANVNEYSARYSILAREFYVPEGKDLAPQSLANKQGRAGGYSDAAQTDIRKWIENAAGYSFDAYEGLTAEDGCNLSRELARIVTPVSTYTEWYWKTDLHNLFHFLRLRANPHAQKEIRDYAEAAMLIVAQWVPMAYRAFLDYRMNAVSFSAAEMQALRDVMLPAVPNGILGAVASKALEASGASQREIREFLAKFESAPA